MLYSIEMGKKNKRGHQCRAKISRCNALILRFCGIRIYILSVCFYLRFHFDVLSMFAYIDRLRDVLFVLRCRGDNEVCSISYDVVLTEIEEWFENILFCHIAREYCDCIYNFLFRIKRRSKAGVTFCFFLCDR